MSRGVSPAKAGWAPVVAVGARALPPLAPAGALDETRAMPRELLLARARRLAWRDPSAPRASTASDALEASASTEPSASASSVPSSSVPSSDTAPSAGVSPRANAPSVSSLAHLLRARSRHAADGCRWLLGMRQRRSRAAGALFALSLVLTIVSFGGSAPGDAGDAGRVEMRALTPTGPSAVSAEPSTRPSAPASDPLESADAVVDAALERRAADALAEGRHADAARLHARLAELHPERPVFRAAARILGDSARELAAAEPGNVVWAGRGGDVR